MTVGVVGAGGIARPHLAAWRHLGVEAVIHSVEGADEVAALYGVRVLPDLPALLEVCDVVDVCTPTYTHREVVLAAAAASRHVICEKPLSGRLADAVEMLAACAAAGVQLHPGQVVRFFPEYAAAKAAVDAGRIGTPAVLRLTRRGARPRQAWFADAQRSGGIIVDQMIHDIDFARWVAGEVTQVFASVVGAAPQPTVGIVVLTHAGGALTHVVGAWGLPAEPFRTSFSISGSNGLLQHSSADATPLRWAPGTVGPAGGELVPDGPVLGSPFVAELAEFAAACAGGPAPRVSANDSVAALRIALAATDSAATGRPIRLDEATVAA